jgi:hypothetical protein
MDTGPATWKQSRRGIPSRSAAVWDVPLCGTGASGKDSRLPDAARPVRSRLSHVRVGNVQSDVLWPGG